MTASLLSERQVKQYERDGYVVIESVFDAPRRAAVDRAIRELTEQAVAQGSFDDTLELEPETPGQPPTPRRIYNPFQAHERFRELALDDRILDTVETLVGPNFNMQHSKLNMKPARVGSVVEWHQDLTYFPHTNDDLVTMLIYLDDATVENGCLQVIPGQHRGYLRHTRDDGTFAGMITENLARFGEPVSLEAPAGSVIFMHCLLPHSSLPNRSDKSRRTFIFEYRAADSFPLYFGDLTVRNEAGATLVRGEPATHARFGNIPPLIPHYPGFVSSLYDLQAKTRAATTTK